MLVVCFHMYQAGGVRPFASVELEADRRELNAKHAEDHKASAVRRFPGMELTAILYGIYEGKS
jgi:hypothetical protein